MSPKHYVVAMEIAGPSAMFTRPDTGASMVSYPAPTFSAAKGMFESVARLNTAYIRPTRVEICRPVQYHRYTTNYGGPLRKGKVIELRPGVAFCFRKFHALVSDLVRGAWLRYVRQQNLVLLGETADLNEFLFGSERNNLAAVRPVLLDLQRGSCFYCKGGISGATAHVDHFVAWARYPVDLGHNFVLADERCNNKKRDRLPACEHLAAWSERHAKFGDQSPPASWTTADRAAPPFRLLDVRPR